MFTESVLGSANRFFYNGRVFWNDGDGFHIYKYNASDGQNFTAQEAKVDANFHGHRGNLASTLAWPALKFVVGR